MDLLGNIRVGKHSRHSWRGGLVVLAICCLAANVVTRYSGFGSEAPSVRTITVAKTQSQESHRQRLLGTGLYWISPVLNSRFFQAPPQASVHAVSAVFLAINLDSESWLYNRPPPSY